MYIWGLCTRRERNGLMLGNSDYYILFSFSTFVYIFLSRLIQSICKGKANYSRPVYSRTKAVTLNINQVSMKMYPCLYVRASLYKGEQ